MRILFVNESTVIKGGVDTVVKMEIEGLIKNGFEVELFEFSHMEYKSENFAKKIKDIFFYFSFNQQIKKIKQKIIKFSPDIVHFHNSYPFFRKPLWFSDLFNDIIVVQHLHNYYPFCINSFFYKNRKICTDCFNKNNFYSAIKYSCYHYSKIKTLLSCLNRPKPLTWIDKSKNVNLFLGVSKFVVDKYVEMGLNKSQVKVLYNGIETSELANSVNTISEKYILYIGNMDFSKGVEIVCELADRNTDIVFKIAGLGKDLEFFKNKYSKNRNIHFLGYVNGRKKDDLISQCNLLLFPTDWWEPFGLVVAESISKGVSVLTSGYGGVKEQLLANFNNYIVINNNIDEYDRKIKEMWYQDTSNFVMNKWRKEFNDRFSSTNHVKNLINNYNTLIEKYGS